jgi:hypothetical protein
MTLHQLTANVKSPGTYNVKLQARRLTGTDTVYLEQITLIATSLASKKGDTGSGTNLTLQEEGVNLPNTPHSVINFVGTGLTASDIGGGVAKLEMIFGANHQETSSESQSNTTSESFQNKLTMTTPSLPAGKYRIGWYAEMLGANTGVSWEMRVQLDDTTNLCLPLKEPRDSTDWFPVSGMAYQTLSAATHTIDIDFRSEDAGVTTSIRRARLEIWRVS